MVQSGWCDTRSKQAGTSGQHAVGVAAVFVRFACDGDARAVALALDRAIGPVRGQAPGHAVMAGAETVDDVLEWIE
jgi:hypothetical protein